MILKLKSVTNCIIVAIVWGQNRQKMYAGCRSVVWGHETIRKQIYGGKKGWICFIPTILMK